MVILLAAVLGITIAAVAALAFQARKFKRAHNILVGMVQSAGKSISCLDQSAHCHEAQIDAIAGHVKALRESGVSADKAADLLHERLVAVETETELPETVASLNERLIQLEIDPQRQPQAKSKDEDIDAANSWQRQRNRAEQGIFANA